ncbi:ABC transporter permease subunit [Paenibacillus chondroitinus]|uniref:ABC transporter permease subunit n=1 Tax=Paenibacillus chondroitinus TaxID=59842 RepID=A0ABU6DAB0_9BACL|nr:MULTISPECIES: ABC transporter permease subunit [Paenibacillus]MCY9662288.1 ABC transporter permease subunit [Paenibacillus anseongense]MEB4794674.1 ABC transporter permease subunit [Paenibacillus chondroitinus]
MEIATVRTSHHRARSYWKRYMYYYILLILPLAYFLIFRYGPIAGNVLAFRKYVPGGPVYGTEWVGLRYFKLFMNDPNFWIAFKNTLVLSILNLAITFPLPILFALLINEIVSPRVKKFIQTVSYFPNFVSIVVVVGMIKELLSPTTGWVNQLLIHFGMDPIFFVNEPGWFRTIYITSDIWQYMGWNAIIYCAVLASVDSQLYEAAELDGASRLKQTIHVTIPQMLPTISVVFILSLGSILSIGFEKALLLYTPSNSATSDIIDTFVFRMGLENSNYSYATAVGMFGGLIGLFLVSGANYMSRKISGISLY